MGRDQTLPSECDYVMGKWEFMAKQQGEGNDKQTSSPGEGRGTAKQDMTGFSVKAGQGVQTSPGRWQRKGDSG